MQRDFTEVYCNFLHTIPEDEVFVFLFGFEAAPEQRFLFVKLVLGSTEEFHDMLAVELVLDLPGSSQSVMYLFDILVELLLLLELR